MMSLLGLGAAIYVDRATQTMRTTRRQAYEVRATDLCEAGVQSVLLSLWAPFKSTQKFTSLDASCNGASTTNPVATVSGSITGVGYYSAGVVSSTASTDGYSRTLRIRAVGWIDLNGNGVFDATDPQKTVDVTVTFQLQRSQVFDYTYFVNNYGWMNGFNENNLIINGDMRANGNFDFTNGSPTVNGSVYATQNSKLTPASGGFVNTPPVKWTNSKYLANQASSSGGQQADNQYRWRPGYDSTAMGAHGSTSYESWRDSIFDSDGWIDNNAAAGAVIGDVNGIKSWSYTTSGASLSSSLLDQTPTKEITMPDLNNISYYSSLSNSYVDSGANNQGNSALTGQGAFLDVWNSSTNSYQRLTTNGVVTGSAIVVGTSAHPVKVHGPVTVTQDVVIKGNISGQGTIYSGRNTHIVGSIRYTNKPNFQGSSQSTIDAANKNADMLGLAANGSIMMGDVTQFSNTTLQYMTPPFTHGRYDDNGNWIAPFDATVTDSTGTLKYKSVVGDSKISQLAEGVNQIDAIMYTNFVGGGNLGTSGGSVLINGSLISRDEAMVIWALPMYMNYDSRVKERKLTSAPLIDISLPRSPVIIRNGWKDQGFSYASTSKTTTTSTATAVF